MAPDREQTAIVQSHDSPPVAGTLPISISRSAGVPALRSRNHVLVRVLAVALNPTDFKMVTYFPNPESDNPIGCDFCGIVEDGYEEILESFPRGTRVCGGLFPYGRADGGEERISGAFAQWVAADARQLLRVPNHYSDLDGAAIGGICWGTCVLGLFADPEALALPGRPSKLAERNVPVLVYGGATATGTMACQLLKLSGYSPIAVTSPASAALAKKYGAVDTAPYTAPDCAQIIRSMVPKNSIHHALDCITSQESVAACFASIARAGGRYACLEKLEDGWRTRRAVRTKEVMGFEGFGHAVKLGDNTYSRKVNMELYSRGNQWAEEIQGMMDRDLIKPHPVCEVHGGWQGIIKGLGMLQRGEVRGQKLVIRVSR